MSWIETTDVWSVEVNGTCRMQKNEAERDGAIIGDPRLSQGLIKINHRNPFLIAGFQAAKDFVADIDHRIAQGFIF